MSGTRSKPGRELRFGLFQCGVGRKGGTAVELYRRYALNGTIMFLNRSCKAVTFAIPEIRKIITERTGIPALVFETDMGDPRFYSEAQIKTRLEAYLETLEKGKPRPERNFHFTHFTLDKWGRFVRLEI